MRELRTAEIIAVGSELLTPHRTDTNSLYLTAKLNELGIVVRAKAVVGDDRGDLGALVAQAVARADLLVLTGGLGPTDDDVTREAVAAVLGLPLVEDPAMVAALRERFARRGLTMPEINRRQAQVPRGASVLPNAKGSASGLWLDAGDRVVVLLPGPPRELQPMFETVLGPLLAPRTHGRRVRRRVIKTTGRAESHIEEIVQPVYAIVREWTIPVETTILAAPGLIELHLSAVGEETAAVERALDEAVRLMSDALGPLAFSVDGRTMEQVVGDLLRDRGMTIAVAESCTGGLIAGRLTEVPGSSAWVVGGVVAYANEVKTALLGVPAALIEEHGAVSEPVAASMAEGVRARLRADVGIGVTGIAGPSGGSPAKPVGTVVIAMDGPERIVKTLALFGDRHVVRLHAVQAALDMVRRALVRR